MFIHLGRGSPAHLPIALEQARLFNKECDIYLIKNQNTSIEIPERLNVTIVPAESLEKSPFHETFLRTSQLDRGSLNGFWFYTTERFYYLHEFMKAYKCTDLFHLENDVMLYVDLSTLLPVFQTHYRGMIGATYEGVERCVPGFMYISEEKPLDELMAFVASRAQLNESDMDSVGRFINTQHKVYIDTLPVLFPNYGQVHGYRFAVPDDRFYNHFEAFDSLFDAAAMGQYLGGDSPVHGVPAPGFINPLSVYDSSHFSFEWELDEKGRRVPFILFSGVKKRINNLHIHSKNLRPFQSRLTKIGILTNWPLSDMELKLPGIEEYSPSSEVDEVIVMNPFLKLEELASVPKEKRTLFIWEPDGASPEYYDAFNRVYTYNDDLIDNCKYFKYCYPSLHRMDENLPSFEERKLCTMIVANWRPERIEWVRFFEGKSPNDFEFYGQRTFQRGHRLYRGKLSGSVHFGAEKIATLKKYRFAICYENSRINGYITEKVFGCFAAGTIPIYLGAPNIETYIPKNCFIDVNDFNSHEEIYRMMKQMSKETYLQYVKNIRDFINSEQAKRFSHDEFYKLFAH